MSDEEFVIDEDESEQSKGEDSDFIMDDADSGSDWDTKGKNKVEQSFINLQILYSEL